VLTTVTTRDIISSNDCLLPRQPQRRGVGAEGAASSRSIVVEGAFGFVQDQVDMGRRSLSLIVLQSDSDNGSLPECGEHKVGDDCEPYKKHKAL
jgi:hypothetical protein